MSGETCSVHGGLPQQAIGHDLPLLTHSAGGFTMCGACAAQALFHDQPHVPAVRSDAQGTGAKATLLDQIADAMDRQRGVIPSASASPTTLSVPKHAASPASNQRDEAFLSAIADGLERLQRGEADEPSTITFTLRSA